MITKPFLRWLGGKAQLLPELRKRMPEHIGTYVEPFVGGGALFYDTCPTQAVLNDANFKLVNLYINVRDHKDELVANLASYELEYNSLNGIEAKQDFYYQTRSDFNADFKINYTARDAAQLVFINKTCFNSLYRENAAGEFNAAFGKRMTVKLYDEENLDSCSKALQDVVLMDGDFEVACRNLKPGDFVYFDPPYHSTFNGYQKGGFSEDDQVRLHDLFQRLTDAGVQCMVSNSNTSFIRSLYAGHNTVIVQAKRMINRNGNGRNGEELIITNYKSNNTRK
jgi:DNA adenine methylase